MVQNSLKGLLIRTAAVRRPDLGFILAVDTKLEANGVEHTIAFRWKAGVLHEGRAKFSAHTCTILDVPEYGVIKMAASGIYSIETRSGVVTGNVFTNSGPPRITPKYGDMRSVATIERKAYAVGFEGTAYRLDELARWTRIDEDLPATFDVEALDGFSASEIYAVGFRGETWQFSGQAWARRDVPTDTVLTAVKCSDKHVFVGGHQGVLLRGRENAWEILDQQTTSDDIWDLEWFQETLYVSTLSGVFRWTAKGLEPVDFGQDPPQTTYQLSAADGVMWSVGRRDIMAFDGARWERIV